MHYTTVLLPGFLCVAIRQPCTSATDIYNWRCFGWGMIQCVPKIIHSHVLGLVLLLQSDAVTSLLTNSDTAFGRKNWHYDHNKAKQFAYSQGYTVLDVFPPPILIAMKHYHDREVKSTIMLSHYIC